MVRAHRACMISAMGFSAVFLTSYLVYHYNVGNVRFSGEGWVRSLYFSILIPHVILAAVIVPLAITTIVFALRGKFAQSSANRALDLAAVDVRVGDGRDRLPDAVPHVHADLSAAGDGVRAVRAALKQRGGSLDSTDPASNARFFVILTTGAPATGGTDLGQLRASEAGTGSEIAKRSFATLSRSGGSIPPDASARGSSDCPGS